MRVAIAVWLCLASVAQAQPRPPQLTTSRPVPGVHANVHAVVTVDATGAVTAVELEGEHDEELRRRVEREVRTWHFEPAIIAGTPSPARVRVEITFAPLPPLELGELPDVSDAMQGALGAAEPEAESDEPEAESDDPRPEPDGFGAEAETELERLRASQRTTSDIDVERDVLEAAPHAEGADILRTAPGLYLARAAGDAVGHRIQLRGFDAEHGQDLEIRVGGLPINLPSHIHGQGYVDLGFLIGEVVDELRVTEGVYDPRQGDFAVAGSVDLGLGVRERGVRLKTSYGSFGTFRALALWAPEGQREDTFAAVQYRRSDGFGQNRNGMNGSAIAQVGFGAAEQTDGWRYRLLGIAHGARYRSAGVLRRDDVRNGRVGFYDVYPEATATAQNAFNARFIVGFEAEHRAVDASNSTIGVWVGFDDFRLQQNFTGFTERSQQNPDWVGRGDLIEQQNRTTTIGLGARHRGKPFHLGSWLEGTLELGLSARLDTVGQAQRLIQAPQNETWDVRVDASIRGADIGAWLDLDLELGDHVRVRGGARADLLYYDIDDRLGNFIPDFREDTFILGYRRSALGIAAGPRLATIVSPIDPLSFTVAYGEGYRSPQARTLEDGETAPFTKVRSADLGTRLQLDEWLDVRLAGYWTRLSDDVAFEPREGRLERIGPTRRLGGVLYGLLRPIDGIVGALSVTYVDAELLEPPPASAEDPSPPFTEGQSLPYVPPWVVRLDLGVNQPLVQLGAHPLRGRVGIGYSHLSARPLPFGEDAEPVNVVDASVGVAWGPIRVSLDVFNLFDHRYAAFELSFPSHWDRDTPRSRLPQRHITAGAPRTLMATLDVQL